MQQVGGIMYVSENISSLKYLKLPTKWRGRLKTHTNLGENLEMQIVN